MFFFQPSFRVIELKLRDNKIFGYIDFVFHDKEIESKDPYSSVIIGINGTGKSNILSIIVNIFREISSLKLTGKRNSFTQGEFNLKYLINNDIFEYSNYEEINVKGNFFPPSLPPDKRRYWIKKNDVDANIEDIELPERVLASSIMLTDKFVFVSKEEDYPQYKYLGIRGTRATAGTRTYIRNTIDYLTHFISEQKDITIITKILNFLKLENYLSISYVPSRKKEIFNRTLTRFEFDNFFKQFEEKYKNSTSIPWYGYHYYKKIKGDDNLIQEITEFIRKKADELKRNKNSRKEYFDYDIINNPEKLVRDYKMLYHIDKLNLIQFPELCIKKKDEEPYDFEQASSGEAHVLTHFIGIASIIRNNSLILIDEPEISYHPNWQMRYISFLKEIFKSFSGCHFIIATHSHFLISDLKGDSSKIIGLTREKEKIKQVEIPEKINTFGWSAEDILYNIFNVASTRNKFVADDIAKILNELSAGDKNKVNKLPKEQYEELLKLEAALKDNDPLKIVVKTILTKVSK